MTSPAAQLAAIFARALRRPAAAAAALLLAGGLLLPASPASAQLITDELPSQVRGMEVADKSGHKLPLDLVFTDSSGQPIRLGDLFNRPGGGVAVEGRPVVVVMQYFRCPLLCPKMVEEVMKALNALDEFTVGTEFDVIFASFDPRDTALDAQRQKTDALMAYERSTTEAIRAGLTFLTGPAATSKALADGLGFPFRFLPDSGEYAHGSVIFVISPDGTVSRALTGLYFPVRDLRLALVEAAEGRIGTLTDRFTLWCYHFDPREGSYVLQAMNVMKLGGAVTVVLLGGFLGVMFLGERRRRHRRFARVELAPEGAATDQIQSNRSDPLRSAAALRPGTRGAGEIRTQ